MSQEIVIRRATHDITCMNEIIEFWSRNLKRPACRPGYKDSSFSLGGTKSIGLPRLNILLKSILTPANVNVLKMTDKSHLQ